MTKKNGESIHLLYLNNAVQIKGSTLFYHSNTSHEFLLVQTISATEWANVRSVSNEKQMQRVCVWGGKTVACRCFI